MTLSLIAAIAGALLYGVASVMQAVAVRRSGGLSALRHPLYLAGLACDGAAWIASLLALHALPLFTVQAILAGSVAVTVVLARLVLAAGPDAGGETAASASFIVTTLVGLGVLVAAAALTYRTGHGIWFAVLAGLASSGAAVSARAAHLALPSGAVGLLDIAKQPLVWAIVGFGLLTVVTFARSLKRAAVGPVMAILSVVDVIVPAGIGLAVLGDAVRSGWALAAVVATVAAVIASAVLAMSPATEAAQGSAAT